MTPVIGPSAATRERWAMEYAEGRTRAMLLSPLFAVVAIGLVTLLAVTGGVPVPEMVALFCLVGGVQLAMVGKAVADLRDRDRPRPATSAPGPDGEPALWFARRRTPWWVAAPAVVSVLGLWAVTALVWRDGVDLGVDLADDEAWGLLLLELMLPALAGVGVLAAVRWALVGGLRHTPGGLVLSATGVQHVFYGQGWRLRWEDLTEVEPSRALCLGSGPGVRPEAWPPAGTFAAFLGGMTVAGGLPGHTRLPWGVQTLPLAEDGHVVGRVIEHYLGHPGDRGELGTQAALRRVGAAREDLRRSGPGPPGPDAAAG